MWSAVGFIILSVLLGAGIYAFRKRRAKRFFSEREILTGDEIFAQFYGDTGFEKNDVLDIWKEVAEVLHVPYGSLRPTDKFGEQIRGYWLIDNELDELSDRTHSRLKKYGKSVNLDKITSLDEYVRSTLIILSTSNK